MCWVSTICFPDSFHKNFFLLPSCKNAIFLGDRTIVNTKFNVSNIIILILVNICSFADQRSILWRFRHLDEKFISEPSCFGRISKYYCKYQSLKYYQYHCCYCYVIFGHKIHYLFQCKIIPPICWSLKSEHCQIFCINDTLYHGYYGYPWYDMIWYEHIPTCKSFFISKLFEWVTIQFNSIFDHPLSPRQKLNIKGTRCVYI